MRTFVVALLTAGALAATASADSVPFTDDGALPWASGATVTSPLEGFAATVATRVAGRPVTVRCEGDTDWQKLAAEGGFNPTFELGYVTFWQTTIGGVPVGGLEPGDFTELSPRVCLDLQRFAAAASKPTKCSAPVTERTTTYETRRVQVTKRVKSSVRVNGKLVTRWQTRTVWVTKRVPVTVERTVPGPPGACFANGHAAVAGLGDAFWGAYDSYAQSLLTLAHEAIHLARRPDEAEAECFGIQWLPSVAEQFGTTSDDARAIAAYTYDLVYPRTKGTEYWSPECRDGGALDLKPSSSLWP